MSYERNSYVNVAKVVQVIQVESVIGKGSAIDPIRLITEFFTLDGKLIARCDPPIEAEAPYDPK